MAAKTIMVVGTASSAGKSLITTAFCRIFKRRGYSVAPFKSQNMSLNSFVTPEGHEMGRAQAAQAEAAQISPTALMNPILLKPSSDRKSQLIVKGKVYGKMSADEYYAFKDKLRPEVESAFNELASQYEVIVIEGAGSPAEINLMENDFVNMGMAAIADCPVVLVGDIDRGGVFASLYGTVKLLPKEDQARIKGLIINKFRGDIKILEPGLRQIEELLGIPVLGVIPYSKFELDEEDSLSERLTYKASEKKGLTIAVLKIPRISNFTDFAIFDSLPDISLFYADKASQLNEADLIIIPGSRNSLDDMRFLEENGFAPKIRQLAAEGRIIVGLGGGFPILGKMIHTPDENKPASIAGLGLLDIETSITDNKHTKQSSLILKENKGFLENLGGLKLKGYENHMGESSMGPAALPLAENEDGSPAGAININSNVFATYLHGFFDKIEFTASLLNKIRLKKGLEVISLEENLKTFHTYQELKEGEYERLADLIEASLDFNVLDRISGLKKNKE